MTNAFVGDADFQVAGSDRSSLPPWVRDGILYVIDVPAFRDGDGDGIGDLRGVRESLDDLAELGVTILWLLPFYESPRQDNGYDVVDHFAVDPRLGTMDDVRRLADEAHRRGLRIIIDLLANHVSSEHPWFRMATEPGDSSMRDRFVWTTEPAEHRHLTPVFPGFERSVWQYEQHVQAWYLHHFYQFEPDLNSDHPAVREYVRNLVTFWLELGIDGFRLDAAPFLGDDLSNGTPDPHAYLKVIRRWIEDVNPEACLLAEADLPVRNLPPYFGDGDEVHGLFDFMLNRRIFLALAEQSAAPVAASLRECPQNLPGQGWVSFLRHHDELSLSFLDAADQQTIFDCFAPHPAMRIYERGIRRRLAPLLENDWDFLRWAFSFQMSLPAAPMIAYGDDIGLQDNLVLPERAAVRTPMAWSEPGATPSHMLLPNIVSQEAVAVPVPATVQREGARDFQAWLAGLIRLRKDLLGTGKQTFELVDSGNPAVLVHHYPGAAYPLLCVHNFSGQPQEISLDHDYRIAKLLLASGAPCAPPRTTARLSIEAHGYRWLLVESEPAVGAGTEAP